MAKVKVTLTKSIIGKPETQRQTVKSLGIKKMHQTVEHEDTPQLRGQIAKVSHLVTVEEI
ncbi:50S ribosomal protein L30 [Jeotgalicoccus huakuii]|nr:50S ribosomal protein L30 [Jeotgalicoccus huakuii]